MSLLLGVEPFQKFDVGSGGGQKAFWTSALVQTKTWGWDQAEQ